MWTKLRSFADIGRAQGITTTASVAIVGALTSTAPMIWQYYLYFTILAIFAHMALNTFIAMGDIEIDSQTYIPSRNPLITKTLTKTQTKYFFRIATIICGLLLIPIFLLQSFTTGLLATTVFGVSYLMLTWYGWKGKKYLFSYDFSFSIAYTLFVLFGVYAIGGHPTIYTWLFIGAVIFAATAFAQWENGLKDADADRSAGVKSLAVVFGVSSNKKIGFFHPYFLYGIALKTGFLCIIFLTFWQWQNILYLFFLLLYGIPTQLYILHRFAKKDQPMDHRRTILLDVIFTAVLGYSVIIEKTTILPVIFLMIYLIAGYLIGSKLQLHCEFKFNRFSKTINQK